MHGFFMDVVTEIQDFAVSSGSVADFIFNRPVVVALLHQRNRHIGYW